MSPSTAANASADVLFSLSSMLLLSFTASSYQEGLLQKAAPSACAMALRPSEAQDQPAPTFTVSEPLSYLGLSYHCKEENGSGSLLQSQSQSVSKEQ